jgi:peptide chain release factor 2
MYSELIDHLKDLERRTQVLRDTLGTEDGARRARELEEMMAQPGFWEQADKAQEVIGEVKRLKREVEPVQELLRNVPDLLELARMANAENDAEAFAELKREADQAAVRVEELELKSVLDEPHDSCGAFLSIHAGAGGTEACDWAKMLARMYSRFAERQGYGVEMIDVVDGEEAGIRSITYQIKGPYAFGYLKAEAGVHRLVRISPFDAKSRRHTSFAAVDVIPELPEAAREIEINPADLKVDTFRAGGAGGQHVNKTESAVRITHLPSGIVVQCQNERSQHSNRATAMRMLMARLVREEEKKREAAFEKHYGEKNDIAFSSQIRSYTLQPFTLVKDHRTGTEIGNANAVLDGEILAFIEAYLRERRKLKREEAAARGARAKASESAT